MAGYTRQSTASIINGSNITAPPLNTEFNQLQAAFNATSGHTHTGGTGDAPKINLATSVSGYLPAAHGGIGGKNTLDATTTPVATNDNSEGYAPGSMWENTNTGRIYICVGSSSNAAVWRELLQVQNGNSILPAATNTVDIGSNTVRFQDLFLSGGIAAAGNTTVGGTLNITGATALGSTLGVTGDTTLANLSATGTTVITSVDLNSGAIDNTTIGSATPAAGTFTTLNANTSLVAATADINGGSLDGATVGASVPSTGLFTTLGASGTSTLATVDINGGNIDGTVIGASTKAAGSFTTLSTTGQATLASADINGGSIDGSTIGANSASTGAFTTLTASGGITGSLTGNVSGNVTGNVTGAVTGNVTGNLTGNVTSSGASSFNNVTIDGTLNMNAGTTATITNLTTPQNSGDAASKGYVDSEISALIGDAGAGLDTLGELADALNDDDAFSTTVTNSIATKLPKAGGTMTGAIAMSTNKITGAGDPTSAQDVSTKAYTDTQRDTRVAKTGDTMSGALAMGNNKITGLGTPTANADASSKQYVDGLFQSTTAAATSATNAATSETNAATSETNAGNSAAAALVSQNAAASSYDNFDDRYLGAKSSAPTVDNDGDALIQGALYFNSTTNIMNVYGSGGWQSAGSAVNGTSERTTYTATAGQTVFAATFDTGYIDVYLNGVKLLVGTDFTATNGTSITLASGASVNDVVDIVAYGTFALADHYTRTASDARYVQPTHTGNLNITGTVTSDGLTVDGTDTEAATSQLLKVRNSTTGEAATIGLYAKADNGGDGNSGSITFDAGADGSASNNELRFNADHQTDTNSALSIKGNGDISFYDDSNNAKFFWDSSAERLGIGTSPTSALHVINSNNTGEGIATFEAASAKNGYVYINADANRRKSLVFQSAGVDKFSMGVGDSDELSESSFFIGNGKTGGGGAKLVIDSSGNVGIGDTVPTNGYLTIRGASTSGTANSHIMLTGDSATVGQGPQIAFSESGASSNWVGASIGFERVGGGSVGDLIFSTRGTLGNADSVPSEALRIDSSQNVLVGGTSAGQDGAVTLSNTGYIQARIDNDTVAYFDRTGAGDDGEVIRIQQNGATVGSIGSITGNNLAVESGNGVLYLGGNNNGAVRAINNLGSGTPRLDARNDATTNIGATTNRFKDLHLSGSITSGANGGLIKEIGGDTSVVQGAVGIRINDAASAISPTTASSNNDGSVDLGVSNIRFKDLHLGGTAYLTNSSSISGATASASSFNIASGHAGSGMGLYIGQFGVSANLGIGIDSNRIVTMPYQPAFDAYRSSGSYNSGNTVTSMDLNSTRLNVGGHYNTASNSLRFTAPVAGVYQFNFRTIISGAYNSGHVKMVKNGVDLQGTDTHFTPSVASQWSQVNIQIIVALNANDYMQVRFQSNTNIYGNSYESFNGHLIG